MATQPSSLPVTSSAPVGVAPRHVIPLFPCGVSMRTTPVPVPLPNRGSHHHRPPSLPPHTATAPSVHTHVRATGEDDDDRPPPLRCPLIQTLPTVTPSAVQSMMVPSRQHDTKWRPAYGQQRRKQSKTEHKKAQARVSNINRRCVTAPSRTAIHQRLSTHHRSQTPVHLPPPMQACGHPLTLLRRKPEAKSGRTVR